jgi:REP element-mobilizing transposase RayT
MPRQSRLDTPGALHHIVIRGIERRKIFWDDADRDDFLERLGDLLKQTRTPCYAWALIPNHVHLLVRTGLVSLATVMRRLLTGYAVRFNRRHRRHGHLFQNRYKSFLCQEDPYLLELVRYIHLNPVRAGLVTDLKELKEYAFSGHSVLMGGHRRGWQDDQYVLRLFGNGVGMARRQYGEYVQEGLARGRRPELVGGGLLRSVGGRKGLKDRGDAGTRVKGDERILGDTDFVTSALEAGQEQMERKYRYKARGYDFAWLVERVGELLDMTPEEVLRKGKYPEAVIARSVVCYFGARELGLSTVELARRLHLSQPAVSQSVQRGEKIASEKDLHLVEINQ